MNKTLLAAYENSPIAAFDLCSIGTVSDFKEVSRYRLLVTGGFEPVAPDGELKHGKLSDQKYSNKADTYGQILTLTRHDIINDDLSAFMDIPRQMGRSGAESIDDMFFTLLLKNSSFFSSANSNLLTGTDTKFGPEALTIAKTTFRKQKAGPGGKPKDQKPINIRPEFLVVPVELDTDAELYDGSAQLMIDAQVRRRRYLSTTRTATSIASSQRHTCRTATTKEPADRRGIYSRIQRATRVRDRVSQWSSNASHRTRRDATEHSWHGLPIVHRLRRELARPSRCGEVNGRVNRLET